MRNTKARLLIVSLVSLCVASACTTTQNTTTQNNVSEQATKQSASSSAQNQLTRLLDQIWQFELSEFPELAKSHGADPTTLDRQFTDISFAALERRNNKFLAFSNALDKIDQSQLSDSEKISLLMQKYRVDNYLSGFAFKEYRLPFTSEYGFHISLGQGVSGMRLRSPSKVYEYKQMLKELPEQFAHNTKYMREGLKHGQTHAKPAMQNYEQTIAPFIVEANIEEHPFYKPVLRAKDSLLSNDDIEEIKQLVTNANKTYQDFLHFYVNEYAPFTKQDVAAKNWPMGEAFYADRTKHYTTTDLSAKQIHEIGLQEVARIRSQMQAIVDKLVGEGEFEGDLKQFIHYLRTDERFYAKTAKELIMYASYVAKKMDAKLPQLFYKMPRTPYGVAPVPDAIAPKYTTGRYLSPSRSDQPGYYWVNTYALDKRPLYAIPALTLHEAVPGHHYQISLAAEMENLPEVRRDTYISAFGEGWGLYSEYLGVETDMYEDPYDDFGRLSYEMWRACRLVVDTGMHMFGWTRQQALDYMLENTALSELNVRTEIDRYITWPGQALSYKIGEIKIKELRVKAEKALGDKFDLRAFHDALLENGSVPLFVLEQQIDKFITNNK